MIEIGKKYRLKKLKCWFEKDSDEFTVVCFCEHNIVGCVAPDGEKYVFDKDYKLYGTKILNLKTQEIGLLICLWENKFADKTVDFATCVDKTGKRYNIELDNIRGFEDDFEK